MSNGISGTSDESFCMYLMADGTTICAACDDPPAGYTSQKPAPAGLEPGVYQSDDPRLAEGGSSGPALQHPGGEV